MAFQLTNEEKNFLLGLARNTVQRFLKDEKINKQPFFSENLKTKTGAFVTLHIDGRLRGCIGYVVGLKSLQEAIQDLAISAAFNDPRFPPVTADQVDKIDIEISVLTPLQRVESIDEIKIGRDGLLIKQPPFEGLLLPQVATEYGWDVPTFLTETCHKAGLDGDCWKDKSTEIYRFQALVFSEHDLA